jgi:hypothetical protein
VPTRGGVDSVYIDIIINVVVVVVVVRLCDVYFAKLERGSNGSFIL